MAYEKDKFGTSNLLFADFLVIENKFTELKELNCKVLPYLKK